jgi:Zn-dependent membrane protease YugP
VVPLIQGESAMPFFYFDPLFLVLSIPPLLLGLWAQMRVKSAFAQYSNVRSASGISGAQAARRILDMNGLQTVTVERTGGTLSDHYDPRHKVLRLSGDVYQTPSLAAVGVAAHEAGHALQDQAALRAAAPAFRRWCPRCSLAVGWGRSSSWWGCLCPAPLATPSRSSACCSSA